MDAILILGNGVTKTGRPTLGSKKRLDEACKHFTGKEFMICLSAATVYKPIVIDKAGAPIFESEACARYLAEKGIPKTHILTERGSFDTIGNAYFARVMHTEWRKLRKLLVVTSKYHMPRTKAVFEWVFNLPPKNVQYILKYQEAPDDRMHNKKLVELRNKKEAEGVANAQKLAKKIKTMQAFHKWLFSEHKAYAWNLKPEKLKGVLLDSY